MDPILKYGMGRLACSYDEEFPLVSQTISLAVLGSCAVEVGDVLTILDEGAKCLFPRTRFRGL